MVSYQLARKRRVRITLDFDVLSDFNPRDIDFDKLFKLEPNESVESYIEDFDKGDDVYHYHGWLYPISITYYKVLMLHQRHLESPVRAL